MTANLLKELSLLNDTKAGWQEVLEVLLVAIYITDAEGRLTYFNSAAEKLSGGKPQLGVDQWWILWKIFLPDGRPLPHDHVQWPLL